MLYEIHDLHKKGENNEKTTSILRQQVQPSDSLSLLAPIGIAEYSENYSFHSKIFPKI